MSGKDPKKVAAGQARQRQLRDQLGEDGYRDLQRTLADKARRKHPDLAARGAHAANAAQLLAWGEAGYIAQRRQAYAALVDKIGRSRAQQRVQRAQEARRQQRLHAPTRGEQILRSALAHLGLDVQLCRTTFDYFTYRANPAACPEITDRTALIEAHVGRYCCDALIPARQLVIEVYGEVHCLTTDSDQRREAFLREQGLTLLILHDTHHAPLTGETVCAALESII